MYGSTDRYDFDRVIEQSIAGQKEVIRALSVLAVARINRHVDYLSGRSK